MRGIVSAAMVVALDDLGFRDSFDAVYGCSAGAINGAYFVARQAWKALPLYYDYMASDRFISFRRALTGRSIADMNYLMNSVLGNDCRLDYPSVIQSSISLTVAITLVDEMKTLAVRSFASDIELRSALLAGAWRPLAVKGTANFEGSRAVDGAVLAPSPFKLAEQDGCSHILSLSTFPAAQGKQKPSVIHRLTGRSLNKTRKGLGDEYIRLIYAKFDDIEELNSARWDTTDTSPSILDISPAVGMKEISRDETDVGVLVDAIREVYPLIHLALAGQPLSELKKAVPMWAASRSDALGCP